MSKKTSYTQNEAVLAYIRKRHNSKMTTEQICNGVKSEFKLKLTNTQVSKCLNRFSVNNLVSKSDTPTGITTSGYKAYRWSYTPSRSIKTIS